MSNVFAPLTAHGNPNFPNSKSHLVQFRAGKLNRREGNWVHADNRKGLVYMDIGPDSLLHFYWKDRTTNRVEDDLIIFPSEAKFVKVEQSNERVYMLAFESSSQKHFFWMQEPVSKAEKDSDLVALVNKAIDDPHSLQQQLNSSTSPQSPSASSEQAELLRLLQQMGSGTVAAQGPNSLSRSPTIPIASVSGSSPSTTSSAPLSEQMQQLAGIVSGIQVPQGEPDVSLSSILTVDNLRPVLGDATARAALFPHLPAGAPETEGELEETIRSPQFKQAMQALAYALRTGQLSTILLSIGLDPATAGNAQGVEALIRAVAAAHSTNQEVHNPSGQQGDDEDRMDTS